MGCNILGFGKEKQFSCGGEKFHIYSIALKAWLAAIKLYRQLGITKPKPLNWTFATDLKGIVDSSYQLFFKQMVLFLNFTFKSYLVTVNRNHIENVC